MAYRKFFVRFDNFHKNMSMEMKSLLETENLVDVTLAVEGRYVKAHKIVLSVCSNYFRELFQSNPCKHPIVFMKDVSYITLRDLLHFLYQGEVRVAEENLSTFIETAKALQITGFPSDSGSQSNSESEQEVEELAVETTVKRVPDATESKSTNVTLQKRFSGPASIRRKFSNVTVTPSTSTPPSTVTATTRNKYKVASVNTNANTQSSDDVDLKMELNETSKQLQTDTTDDSELEYYSDVSAGFKMTDETEDDEPKPGTSSAVGDNQDDLIFSITTRGRKCLLYNNCVYYLNQVRDNRIFWVCSDYYKVKCRSRIVTDNANNVRKLKQTHNHPPQIDKIRKHFNATC